MLEKPKLGTKENPVRVTSAEPIEGVSHGDVFTADQFSGDKTIPYLMEDGSPVYFIYIKD